MTIAKSTPRGLTVPVQQFPHAQGLPLPAYQTAGSAGMDLAAAVPEKKPLRLAAAKRVDGLADVDVAKSHFAEQPELGDGALRGLRVIEGFKERERVFDRRVEQISDGPGEGSNQ